MSLEDSRELAKNLGVRYDEIPIGPHSTLFCFAGEGVRAPSSGRNRGESSGANPRYFADGLVEQIRSDRADHRQQIGDGGRLRDPLRDMAGGFAVIKDILKTLVYRLCRHRNGIGRVIPERVLTRAPSAELKANQTDQEASLPMTFSMPSFPLTWRTT